ncbi:MAG: cbb3-type cytochrome c oxidase subunit 3 [Bacteroidetes bacterium]|nr:cbb3-type cytochrome c oxidase subunit 3 [Bacteroidota bacterium]
MFSKYFESVEWYGIFAIATMILFVISFIVMLIWAFRIDKKKLEEYNNLPLENNKNFQDE